MARDENPPFARGETFYNGTTIDTANKLTAIIGKEWVFEDVDLSTQGSKSLRTNRKVVCRVVRNDSGIALLPKRSLNMKAGLTGQVDGYTTATAGVFAGVVDEWLPAAGCPNNDACWVVVEGPTQVLTDLAGGANNLLPADTILVALTAVTSQATTAGRVAPQDVTGATTALANNVQNAIGRALSAATTTQTNSGLLANIFARKW